MTLSEKITYLRKRDRISQEELAEKLSVSRQSIYKWENGECLPTWDKIKTISKLFNVSFDFLMDDTIDAPNLQSTPNTSTAQKTLNRVAFNTNISLDWNQPDIDNGYDPNVRKAKLRNDYYIIENIQKSKDALKKLGITDVFQVQPDSATFFFFDTNNYTCGFFYARKVQFVCPIENILGFTYGGGNQRVYKTSAPMTSIGFGNDGINSIGGGYVPTLGISQDSTAWATLSYKNQKNEVKQYELNFNAFQHILVQECKEVEELEFMLQLKMEELLKNLNKLQMKISSLSTIGNDIKSGKIEVTDTDYTKIKEMNVKMGQEYSSYCETIEQEAISDNTRRLLFIGGAIVLAGFLIALFFMNI